MRNSWRIGLSLLAALIIAPQISVAQVMQDDEDIGPTRLVLLGTGTPNAKPDRMGPSLAIVVGDNAYIVDAGTGLVRRAAEAWERLGIRALEPKKLKIAFLTHLHSDHTLGLADLVLTPWVLGREEPLRLYGPAGTRLLAEFLIEAYAADIKIRISSTQPQNSTGFRIGVRETNGGFVYSDRYVSVEAFRVCHGEITDSFGYRFTTPDKVIVISGDTGYCPIIAEMAKGADILVHEVYSEAGFRNLPEGWAAYHKAHHTAASDVARIAAEARPGLLVLTHQLSWGDVPTDVVLAEVQAAYDGKVAYGRDLDVY